MNTASVKDALLRNFQSKEYREAYSAEHVYITIAFQIRALREQRGWSQKYLGRQAQMAQERVSILEDPNSETKPALATLLRIASGLDVGLEVRFVSFGTIRDNSFNNDPRSLQVPSFADEEPARRRKRERKLTGRRKTSRSHLKLRSAKERKEIATPHHVSHSSTTSVGSVQFYGSTALGTEGGSLHIGSCPSARTATAGLTATDNKSGQAGAVNA